MQSAAPDGNSGSAGSVSELGEGEVLRRVLSQYGQAPHAVVGPGDDCAVLGLSGDTVITTDTMIEGPDFRLAWHSGFELGWKLAATNLSDVAAMGAVPVGLTVAIACPGDTPVELLEEIARGLNAACVSLAPECGVIGGDLGRASALTASVTAIGDMRGCPPVLRSGARAGEVIAYAGSLGLAGIGLSLLFTESADADGTANSAGVDRIRSQHGAALRAQLSPDPPVSLGVVAAQAGATAMLDVSDGLAIDAARIARASKVRIDLSAAQLESEFGLQHGERLTIDAMLYGGEDHGLLATFPAEAELPHGFTKIGTIRAAEQHSDASNSHIVMLDGEPCMIRGWDPFTVRPPGS